MASVPCAKCAKAARATNSAEICTSFNSERGCRFGADCKRRHGQKVCEFYLQGHCTKSGCTFSHNLQKPCTHGAAAAAAPPSPADSAPIDEVAAKQSTLSAETPAYVPVERLYEEIEALSCENAMLQGNNNMLQFFKDNLYEECRLLKKRNSALVSLLRTKGMSLDDIDKKVAELKEE